MPKEVAPEPEKTPNTQRQNSNPVTGGSSLHRRRAPNTRNDGTSPADATQLFSSNTETPGDINAAAAAMVGLSAHGSTQQYGEDSIVQDFVDERMETRSIKRMKKRQESESNGEENKEEEPEEEKETKINNKEEKGVKLGEWHTFHPKMRHEELQKKRGIYIIVCKDGTVKIGYIYSDDHSDQTLHKRLYGIVVHYECHVVQYRFLDTGNALTEDAVITMERCAHFVLFLLKTPEGKSRYVGVGEKFVSDRDRCDKILERLRDYGLNGSFTWTFARGGPLNVSAESVEEKSHPRWTHFSYKFGLSAHTHPECEWIGDTEGSEEYWDKWVDFVRSDRPCKCIENAT